MHEYYAQKPQIKCFGFRELRPLTPDQEVCPGSPL